MENTSAAIIDYWNTAAATFDDEPDHGLGSANTRQAWARLLDTWLPSEPADVLDVGCGTGSLSLLAALSGHRVTGVDAAPRMVDQARAKFAGAGRPASFLVGDAAAPPVDGERFDVVLSRHLVWTLPDPEEALRAWVGLLRPGGRLVLVEGRWGGPGQEAGPYVEGADRLPWGGGVSAQTLADAARPLVAELRIEELGDVADLWGGPVHDERYALIAVA